MDVDGSPYVVDCTLRPRSELLSDGLAVVRTLDRVHRGHRHGAFDVRHQHSRPLVATMYMMRCAWRRWYDDDSCCICGLCLPSLLLRLPVAFEWAETAGSSITLTAIAVRHNVAQSATISTVFVPVWVPWASGHHVAYFVAVPTGARELLTLVASALAHHQCQVVQAFSDLRHVRVFLVVRCRGFCLPVFGFLWCCSFDRG